MVDLERAQLAPLSTQFLPPANEVCEGYVFTSVCQSFCSQGVSVSVHAGIHTPHPPPPEQTPWSRHTPSRSRCHPHRSRHTCTGVDTTTLEQTPPRSRHPREQTPSVQCMLGDTGIKRAVRILLKCILVSGFFWSILTKYSAGANPFQWLCTPIMSEILDPSLKVV